MGDIKLIGRIFVRCNIEALTGLHIGGMGGILEIGGVDNPVVRDLLTQEPYIPGSSLRGKMRSQLERKENSPQNQPVGKAKIHICKDGKQNDPCKVCRLFGLPASDQGGTPTLLLVRDVRMTQETVDQLTKAHTDQQFTEMKAEVAIDRVTSMASPRNLERVPAGAVFGPCELVLSIFQPRDIDSLKDLRDCLQLVEDDYLGGGGSRGNGKIRFQNLKVSLRSSQTYSTENSIGTFQTLKEFEEKFDSVIKEIKNKLLTAGG